MLTLTLVAVSLAAVLSPKPASAAVHDFTITTPSPAPAGTVLVLHDITPCPVMPPGNSGDLWVTVVSADGLYRSGGGGEVDANGNWVGDALAETTDIGVVTQFGGPFPAGPITVTAECRQWTVGDPTSFPHTVATLVPEQFMLSAAIQLQASSSSVAPGGSITFTQTAPCVSAAGGTANLWGWDADGSGAFGTPVIVPVDAAGNWRSITWNPPSDTPPGAYTLQVGCYSSGGSPTFQYANLNPTVLPPPNALRLLGLGDSIAAGHGLGPSDGLGDNSSAYPMLVAAQLGYTGNDYAISGACAASPGKDGGSSLTPSSCTKSVLSDELKAVTAKPDVITLTVGGNDIRFGECFKAVILNQGENPCKGATFKNNLSTLSQNLGQLFAKIKEQYPGVPIFAMQYYNMFPEPASLNSDICPLYRPLAVIKSNNKGRSVKNLMQGTDGEAANLQNDLYTNARAILKQLNSTIQAAAAAAGVKTVPLFFGGHDFCRSHTGGTVSDTWVYGPSINGTVSATGVINKTVPFDFEFPGVCPAPHLEDSSPYEFDGSGLIGTAQMFAYALTAKVNCFPHPTIDGQKAIAEAFRHKISP